MNSGTVVNFTMRKHEKDPVTPLFSNPLEAVRGMTIADLNRYLPAVRKADDIRMTHDKMKEGVFVSDGLVGLSRLPDNSIDLIIADPPETPILESGKAETLTLQDYYQWNEKWLEESKRVLKTTGSIYLLCGWRYSGMYHALLSNYFQIRTRITWRDIRSKDQPHPPTWRNSMSDIWFATKSGEFMFNQRPAEELKHITDRKSQVNFWDDIHDIKTAASGRREGDRPERLLEKILDTSSFKLNWIVDPFMRNGDVGVAAKISGRRFIGFEKDQDKLLMAMKRIDNA